MTTRGYGASSLYSMTGGRVVRCSVRKKQHCSGVLSEWNPIPNPEHMAKSHSATTT